MGIRCSTLLEREILGESLCSMYKRTAVSFSFWLMVSLCLSWLIVQFFITELLCGVLCKFILALKHSFKYLSVLYRWIWVKCIPVTLLYTLSRIIQLFISGYLLLHYILISKQLPQGLVNLNLGSLATNIYTFNLSKGCQIPPSRGMTSVLRDRKKEKQTFDMINSVGGITCDWQVKITFSSGKISTNR